MLKVRFCHSERFIPSIVEEPVHPSTLRSSTLRLRPEGLRLEESLVEGLVPSKAEGSKESEFILLT
jgi:hypothetical protein